MVAILACLPGGEAKVMISLPNELLARLDARAAARGSTGKRYDQGCR
jgi:hypothetical protein